MLRRPAWIWTPLGFVAAPLVGVAVFVFVMTFSSSPGSILAPTPLGDDRRGEFVAAFRALAVPALLASLSVGVVWAAISRKAPRKQRWTICVEVFLVGVASACLWVCLAYAWAALQFSLSGAYRDAQAAALTALASPVLAIIGGVIFVLPITLTTGPAFAFLVFAVRRDGRANVQTG